MIAPDCPTVAESALDAFSPAGFPETLPTVVPLEAPRRPVGGKLPDFSPDFAGSVAKTTPPAAAAGDAIGQCVGRLLHTSEQHWHRMERRRDQRYPFPHLIVLTPVNHRTLETQGEPVVVVGKHLSKHGLDFYHQTPLPYRWVLAALEGPDCEAASLLMELTWCRFRKHGWYDSGGKFIRRVTEQP